MLIPSNNDFDAAQNASQFEAGGAWEAVAANYPELVLHLDSADVTEGDTTWADKIGDVVVAANTSFTVDAEKGVGGALKTTGSISAGTLPVIAGKTPVMISVGTYTAGNVKTKIGDPDNTGGMGLEITGGSYITINAAAIYHRIAAVSPVPSTYPFTGAQLLAPLRATNDVVKVIASQDGTYSQVANKSSNTGDLDVSWAAFNAAMSFPANAGSFIKNLYLFAFTDEFTTAELTYAANWMAANPGKICPIFARRG